MEVFTTLVFSAYKKKLVGLPSFCRLVMLEVFEYCDYSAGTILINSLDKLARDHFQVDAARGRQKENINGDTIRNAFRTIKKAKSDHFKFITVNQQIVIDMSFLRDLYQSFFNETQDVAALAIGDVAAVSTHTRIDESVDLETILAGDVAGILAAACLGDANNACVRTSAKIKPNFKPNNNNEKQSVSELPTDVKKTIPDDFQPSHSMIDNALRLGLPKVTDPLELNKFIIFNKSTGSRWANWDYVYLNWLIRDVEREQKKAAAKSQQLKPKCKQSGSTTNEYTKYPSNMTTSGRFNHGTNRYSDKSRATQQVIAAWSKDLDYCEQTNRFNARSTPNPAPVIYIDIDSLGPID